MFRKFSLSFIGLFAFLFFTQPVFAFNNPFTVSNVLYNPTTHELSFDISNPNPSFPYDQAAVIGLLDDTQGNSEGGPYVYWQYSDDYGGTMHNYNCNNWTHCDVILTYPGTATFNPNDTFYIEINNQPYPADGVTFEDYDSQLFSPLPITTVQTTVTFDDINSVQPLNGEYKGINWGLNNWDVDSSIASDNTNSASFHSSSATSETFSFDSQEVLISAGVYSNSNQAALITLSCSGNPNASQLVAANSNATLITNWTTPCTTVTVTSSNGWNTNLDNIVYASSSNVTPTPPPTPSGQILGNSETGSQIDTGDSGYINGSKFTTSATGGTTQNMSVFVGNIDSSANHQSYQMAIYTDNNGIPGALVTNTVTGTLTALSWNTLPITATLNPNTTYWLMYSTNGRTASVNNMYYDPGTTSEAAYAKHTFGSWPTTFPTASLDSPEFSIYVTYQ